MISVNEYFEGTVKSLGFNNAEGKATVGVMEPGEYTFGTSTVEYMTVISGSIDVQQPNETEWNTYKKGETFVVAKDVKFKVKMTEQTAYYCRYE